MFQHRFTLLLVVTLLLAACSTAVSSPASQPELPQAEVTPTSITSAYLSIEYPDAASLRNQLAFGILKMEGTPNAVSAQQAAALLPLWQAIIALSGDTSTASEELTAVQNQIAEALLPGQLQAIAALATTNADLSAFYAERGIVLPTPVPGVTKVPGSGKDLSTEDKEATRTAAEALGTPTGSGAGQAARTLLFDEVVKLLSGRAAQ